jgi:hypothetical protein
VLPLAVACLVAGGPIAAADVFDRDTGFDPDDVPSGSGRIHPDIRSTTRKLVVRDGRRVIAIVVRFYEADAGYPLAIQLDAREGPKLDHRLLTFSNSCLLWRTGHRGDRRTVRFAARGRRAVCRFPARFVDPTKSIRWKLWTYPPDGSRTTRGFVMDHAPDHGWYG